MTVQTDFPVIDEAISFQSQVASPGGFAVSYWTSVMSRSIGDNKTRRGKQNELDTVQTGEYNCTWSNLDGALNPLNTASPFYPNVVPFREYRKRAQWPPTQQLITADQATMGDASGLAAGTGAASLNMLCPYATATIAIDANAWQGTRVMVSPIPANPAVGSPLLAVLGWSSEPNVTFSFQGQIRCTTAGVNPQVAAALTWIDVKSNQLGIVRASTVTLTGGSNPSWTQVTISATAPANAAGALASIDLLSSPTSSFNIQCDGFQVERAAAPTSWVQPGTWYPFFSGWVERYPQQWTMEGTFSEVTPTVVDTFGYLSQKIMRAPFYSTVLSMSPAWFYPLDDPKGAAQVADLTGNKPAAPVVNSPFGAGSCVLGSSITSTTSAGAFVGTPGPVCTMNNANVGGTSQPMTVIELDKVGIAGPPASGGWTRMVAFRCSAVPVNTSGIIWAATSPTYVASGGAQGSDFYLAIQGSPAANAGNLLIQVYGGIGSATTFDSGTSVCDGNWHLAIITLNSAGTQVTYWLDGSGSTVTPGMNINPTLIATEVIGGYLQVGANYSYDGYQGDVAHVAQFNTVLTSAQMTDLYTSWRTAYATDTTGARYQRILQWAGFNGATSIQSGNTTSMGPASDIAANDALTCLQNVVVTENGNHYMRADGTIAFEQRGARITNLIPKYVFGEKTALGEIPYEDVGFDFDVTKIANDVKVTQYSTNQIFSAFDQTSQNAYGTKSFQRTVNTSSALECTDAANYFNNRLKQPAVRLSRIRIHPSARPGLAQGLDAWAVCLGLEISTLVTVMRRPPGQPAIQFSGFIESIAWSMGPRSAFVDLEISPATKYRYWVHGALHSTLNVQGTAGGAVITVNALQDAATNPFKASVPSGLQMTLEPGTVRSETLTVLSVQATSPGYTTCQVTFTTNMAFTHPVNSVVCEALPAGQTSPSLWDAACVWDQTTVWGY